MPIGDALSSGLLTPKQLKEVARLLDAQRHVPRAGTTSWLNQRGWKNHVIIPIPDAHARGMRKPAVINDLSVHRSAPYGSIEFNDRSLHIIGKLTDIEGDHSTWAGVATIVANLGLTIAVDNRIRNLVVHHKSLGLSPEAQVEAINASLPGNVYNEALVIEPYLELRAYLRRIDDAWWASANR